MSRVRRNTKLYAILRLRRARRLREALGALRKLARQRPTEAMVYFYLAVTLDNMGRERAAIPRYHRALRLDPRHPHTGKINLYLASSYCKTGRPRAARRYLGRATAIGIKSALQRRIGRLLERDS